MQERRARVRCWGALVVGAWMTASGAGCEASPHQEASAQTQRLAAAHAVVINEVESSGDTSADWVELYNAGEHAVDLSGYRFKDEDDSHTFYVIPAGTQLAAGAFLVLDQAQFGFGLGSSDSARLFAPTGEQPVAASSWTTHAAVTYGRWPNGTGEFRSSSVSTRGAANNAGTAAAYAALPR